VKVWSSQSRTVQWQWQWQCGSGSGSDEQRREAETPDTSTKTQPKPTAAPRPKTGDGRKRKNYINSSLRRPTGPKISIFRPPPILIFISLMVSLGVGKSQTDEVSFKSARINP